MKKGIALLILIGIVGLCFIRWSAVPITNYYQIYEDTLRFKAYQNFVTPTVGNTITCIDTFGDYVTNPMYGVPALDSIATSGATITPAVNGSYTVTSTTTISGMTITFPAGLPGQWILINYEVAVTAITNSGTNAQSIGLTAATKGQSRIYLCDSGKNWR